MSYTDSKGGYNRTTDRYDDDQVTSYSSWTPLGH
jgi:hypothetical protein